MPVLEREEYIEQAYFFRTVSRAAHRRAGVAGNPGADRRGAAVDDQAAAGGLVPARRDEGNRPDGAGHGADQPLFHAVSGPRRQPGRERHRAAFRWIRPS